MTQRILEGPGNLLADDRAHTSAHKVKIQQGQHDVNLANPTPTDDGGVIQPGFLPFELQPRGIG